MTLGEDKMKRTIFGLTVAALLAPALIAVTAPEAQAAKSAVDVAGTITVTETADYASGDNTLHHRASMVLALPGPMQWVYSGTSSELSSVDATIQSINYTHEETWPTPDDTICHRNRTITGWIGGDPPVVGVSFSSPSRDQLSGKAKAYAGLYDSRSMAIVTYGGDCGGFDETYDVIDKQDQFNPWRKGLFSSWMVDNADPKVVVSPEWINFKKVDSRWVSQGTKTLKSGNYTVKVSWNLTSKVPSTRCAVPKSKTVKNKTVKQTKKIINKAGFKPGKTHRSQTKGVKRGRVFALSAEMFASEARCGSKVEIYVRK